MLFIEQNEVVALVGLGGIGKTQVALQFAYLVKVKNPEYSIFWVSALSEASFEKAYAELSKELGVKKSKEDEDVKDLIRRHLRSEKAGKWLLIIDNADDIEVLMGSNEKRGIYRYLPASETGRVIFTTRSREVAGAVAGSHIVDLLEMSPEEAMVFVETTLTRKELLRDKATTVELVRELTYLPLAIAQAVAYLNQNQISVRKYLGLLQGTEQNKVSLLSREFYDQTRYERSQNAVATTWLVSFAQIQRFNKAAASILGFMSYIEPKAIPRSILPEIEPEEVMEHAIGTLKGYAFLSQRGDEEMFDMHSLVHVATRVWLESEGLTEQTMMDAICHIKEIFPPCDLTSREKWRGYIPHGLQLLNRSNWCRIAERYHLLLNVGLCLDQDRRFKEAIRCFEAAGEWKRDYFTEDGNSRLMSEHTLASTYLEYTLASAYLDDRQTKKAIEILEHIVAVRRTLEDEDKTRLTSEHELARAYLDNGQIKEAIGILEHIVAVAERTLAKEDYSRLTAEHTLASAYLDNGQTKKAIKILEHIMVIEKTPGDKDNSQLSSEHELARAYLDDGQTKKAIEILEHIVAIEKRTLADDDDSRLLSEHELARAYLDNGQTKKAIEILEHIVAIEKRTLADDDNSRLISLDLLTDAYTRLESSSRPN
jgi:tetratricopeptide (TPR) repeat protein